jgi:hypothetical protein
VVHCSLCRTLAIVPRDSLPEDVRQQATTTSSQAPPQTASAAPAEAGADAEEVAQRPSYVYFGRFALRF